jgi:hypothetical protein
MQEPAPTSAASAAAANTSFSRIRGRSSICFWAKCPSLELVGEKPAKNTTRQDHTLRMISKSALIWLSRQEGLKDFAARFAFFKKLTTRFVAGEDIDEAVSHIREINAENCSASFDHLN